jgi:hypothetical protein
MTLVDSVREYSITLFCAFICASLLVCSKGANDEVRRPIEGEQGRKPVETTSESPEAETPSQFGLIQSDPNASEAWLHFIANGRYRMANASDLQLSSISDTQHHPFGTGDFNRDGSYSDFAAIVVDTSRNDLFKFSLIIFNHRKQGTGYDGPFWLFRDVDLSGSSLTTSSHGPLLVVQESDRGVQVCIVEWNQDLSSYACRSASKIG